MDEVVSNLKSFGQEHLLNFYGELSETEKAQLLSDVGSVDWNDFRRVFNDQVVGRLENGNKLKPPSKIDDALLEPLSAQSIEGTMICEQAKLDQYEKIGLDNIKSGKVAALLLAGGQGSRLGVDYPKGMYDIGLPSHKTLFQLQAERILQLAGEFHVYWYIMTSESTMERTREFLIEHKFFGLDDKRVIIFEQSTIPAFDFTGRALLEKKSKLFRSPNGNGGLFEALHQKGIIDHMKSNNIEYLHVYCVDNVLVRVCDPKFVGYCISKGVDAGAKVVEKTSPNEAVGTICKVDNKFRVIEYSEISEFIASQRDKSTGKLLYNAGNICDQFFKVAFLESIKGDRVLPYHIALKKIPHISLESGELVKPEQINGVKFEKFIFDAFEFTDRLATWQVKREDEFSPVKNGPTSEKDNPTTALNSLLRAYELGILKC